ncbi:EamA family transporter [Carboxydochorda subterranea]|uniref:EamA family transporter n=1 Tax=Carboxydichorda subterranea TaxID=3109565 RepID=A0ABZ1C1S8_9FIRM|nr:EamA family transporter [Limnochorda sp. L945t]WRP18751.1 EamA family transporter [Limnochorda sp. L945t]
MSVGTAVAFAALSFIWGSTYLFIKVGVEHWPPFMLAGLRNLTACLALLAVMAALRRRLPRAWREWWPPLVFAALNGAAFALIFWGERFIPSGQAAVLVATMPLFTLPLARLWSREPVRLAQMAAVVVGFAGVLMASGVREGTGFAGSAQMRMLAQAGMLAAAFCYAASYVFSKRFFRADTYTNTAIHLGASGLYLLALSLAAREVPDARALTWPALGSLGYLALVGSALAYWLMFYLIDRLGSVQASYVTLINPVVAVALGVLLLGEPLTWGMAAGTVAVVAGAWLVHRRPAGRGRLRLREGSRRTEGAAAR